MSGPDYPGDPRGLMLDGGETVEARDRRLRDRIGELITEYLAQAGKHRVGVGDEERIGTFCRTIVEEEVRRGHNSGAPPVADPEALIAGLRDWQLGLGPLEPLLRDPAVTEIMVNGPGRVMVERGGETTYTTIRFHDDDELRALITRLADRDNRPFNRANPTVELQLADGSRLHALTAPIVEGTTVTIRKFKPIYSDLATLVDERAMLPPMAADFLAAAIHCGANVLIAGETNSGKCVAPDTPLVLGDGRRAALGPLVDAALADPAALRVPGEAGWEGVRFPHPVWTVDPDTGAASASAEAVAWRHPAPPTLVAVTLETGETLTVTAEHPFLLAGAGPPRFVPAGALTTAQWVAVAPPPPPAPTADPLPFPAADPRPAGGRGRPREALALPPTLDADWAWLGGILAVWGHRHRAPGHDRLTLTVPATQRSAIGARAKALLEGLSPGSWHVQRRRGPHLRCTCRAPIAALSALGGPAGPALPLPDWVWTAPPPLRAAFLAGGVAWRDPGPGVGLGQPVLELRPHQYPAFAALGTLAGWGLRRLPLGRERRRHYVMTGAAPIASPALVAPAPAPAADRVRVGVRVAGVTPVPTPAPAVYDLTVPGTATYCLGHGGIVTHNTTLLTALILAACTIDPRADPAGERIVVIETARELQLQRGRLSHVISLQVVEGAGGDGARSFSERDLVYQALRMNPRRLVLGEVRNEAAFELLDGLNTGHRGSAATIHANTPPDTLLRLATLAQRAPNAPAREVIMQMIASTINLVVQVERIPNSERRVVTAIAEGTPRVAEGTVPLNDLWVWDDDTDRLVPTAAMLSSRWLARIRRHRLPLEHLDEARLARQVAEGAGGGRP